MKNKYELNREYAVMLSKLITDNPNLKVIAWVISEGITDEYAYWKGDLDKPHIQTIAYSNANERYIERENDDYENCCNYYGWITDDWDDEMIRKQALIIPWEKVIAIPVSIV